MLITPATSAFSKPKGFLVIEGVNGAGKSTLIRAIEALARERGNPPLVTREPGATPLGAALRSLVLEEKAGKPSPTTEIFLFAADRAEHVATVIQPALKARKPLVSDRYFYSTLAFQGYGRGLDLKEIQSVTDIAIRGVLPDLVILLDLDPAAGLARTKSRQAHEGTDAFEKEELAFHTRLREGFLTIAKTSPTPFLVVDATKGPEEVFAFVKPVIEKWLSNLSK